MRKHGWIVVLVILLVTAPGWAATRKTTKTTVKAPAKPKTVMKQTAHFTIKSDLPQTYIDAILNICEHSLDGYKEVFGFSLYPNPYPTDKRIFITAMKNTKQNNLEMVWDTKPIELHLAVYVATTATEPKPIENSDIFELAREFGYPVACFANEVFNRGLMNYLGSYVTDYVKVQLAAPDTTPALFAESHLQAEREQAKPGTAEAAAGLLDRIGNTYGKDTLAKAVRLVMASTDPTWQAREGSGVSPRIYKVAALCRQLVDLTNDGEIEEWFREAHFPTVLTAVSVTPEEIWTAADYNARCQLLCARWGTNTNGMLGDSDVQLIYQIAAGDKPKGTAQTPEGVIVTGVDTKGVMVWYQPATKRTYISGTAKVIPSGLDVTDDALDETGQALGLNKKAGK